MEDADRIGSLQLEGRLLDEQGHPVAGARVSLDTPACTTTDHEGRFGFAGLAGCMYRVYARKDDLCLDVALVTSREDREPVCLTMSRGMTVCLLVLDGESPVAGARIVHDGELLGTDASGLATVRGVGAHFQMFEVAADGYAPTCASMSLASDPGGTIERTVQLVRGAPLAGVVVGPEGDLIADATVRISGDHWGAEARADAHGAWRVDAVAAGQYQVAARAKPYAPGAEATIDLDGKTPRTDVVVRMEQGARVTGRVLDEAHTPVPYPFLVASMRGTRYPESTEVRGDEHGRYELFGLAPGTYDVFAHEGHLASPQIEVVLADGDAVALDFAVERAAIAGLVVDPVGAPIPGARVTLHGDVIRGDIADRLGRFDLGAMPPGEYQVRVRRPSQHEQAPDQHILVRTAIDARVVLAAHATITGRVVLDGSPMQRFGLRLTECPQYPWIGSPIGVHATDGRFTLAGITPGMWGLVVAGPGTALHTIAEIAVAESEMIDLGDIHMARGQRITGCVRDATGLPVGGARVTIGDHQRDDENETELLQHWFCGYAHTLTAADGRFLFDSVPRIYTTPITATHRDHGTSVTLTVPEGDATVELTLLACGAIDGVVEGYSGRVAGIVARRRGGDAVGVRHTTVRPTATFAFERLPPGDYTIEMITPPDNRSAPPVDVSVVANQRTTVRLAM